MIKVLDLLQQKSIKALEKAKKLILSEKIESKRAREALKYYVKNWNDTTHPGLLALACEAVGGNIEKIEPMQIVMLYLTAAMDLHDDIIDESKVKNGKTTVFGKYGKDITLLLGNAMMIKGFTFLLDYSKKLNPKTLQAILKVIKDSFFNVGNAHLLEIDFKNKEVSPVHYLRILERKASLLEAHMTIGAILGEGNVEEIKTMKLYGKNLGILISLREEFIDIFEPEELKNRMKSEILPLPLLYAFINPHIKNKMLKILSKPKISSKDTEKIIECTFRDKNVKKLKNYMRKLAKEAFCAIKEIKNKQIRKDLTLLIQGSLEDL